MNEGLAEPNNLLHSLQVGSVSFFEAYALFLPELDTDSL
jgi:hypothetical protein